MEKNIKVLVSGTYDVLHGGHIQFFEDARKLGDSLSVCFASEEVIKLSKGRKAAYPDDHKKKLLESIKWIDFVLPSSDVDPVFNFAKYGDSGEYQILAVTSDDKNAGAKAERFPNMYVAVLPKRNNLSDLSTTQIRENIKNE